MLTAVARCAPSVLIAAISSVPALAEVAEGPGARDASAPAAVGEAVFPTATDPKYAHETPGRAQLHTCMDQYNRNKAANANGGLKWIERGGGYYARCYKRLGGVLPGPAPLREGGGRSLEGERPDEPSAKARGAFYKVQDAPAKQGKTDDEDLFKCLYRNNEKFFCPDTERIAFEQQYRTKDYDFIVISTSFSGSGNRWWGWKLIVEDGKRAIVKPLAEDCLACDIRVEKLNFQSNEIVFVHRQAKRLQTASFRAGQFTLQKSKLDPHEPLDEETCGYLFETYEGCRNQEITLECRMAPANSSHFALLRIEDQYAGISYEGVQRMCTAACSGGEALDKKAFMKKVCRR
ncbi:hypothetical protein BwSG20_09960 [Bradyrhizobium ottawaense]|nr:hypothetical protein BwSG20_09960 [Bradyrhizobium ottawaense]